MFSDKQDPWYDVPAVRNKTAIEPETRIESIGEIYNVIQYAAKEWKSDTATAQAVRAVRYKTFALPYELYIITLTSTSIILHITKTLFNNCLLLYIVVLCVVIGQLHADKYDYQAKIN